MQLHAGEKLSLKADGELVVILNSVVKAGLAGKVILRT